MLTSAPSKINLAKATKVQAVIEAKRKDDLKDRMDSIELLQKEIRAMVSNCLNEDDLKAIYQILCGHDYEIAGD